MRLDMQIKLLSNALMKPIVKRYSYVKDKEHIIFVTLNTTPCTTIVQGIEIALTSAAFIKETLCMFKTNFVSILHNRSSTFSKYITHLKILLKTLCIKC